MKRKQINLSLTSTENMLLFIYYLEKHGITWQKEANRLSLPSEINFYEQWIPIEHFSKFVDLMRLKTKDNTLGARVGLQSGNIISNTKADKLNIVQGLESLTMSIISHSSVVSRHVSYWLEKINSKWCLCHSATIRPTFPGYDQVEWFRVSLLISIFKQTLGKDWQPNVVLLMTSEHQGRKCEKLFPKCSFIYEQEFSAIELPLNPDFTPLHFSRSNNNNLQEILLLANSYSHLRSFNADWLASLFGTTRRTLHRYLDSHNTSFRAIKEKARYNTAEQLLFETSDSIDSIAFQLGYSDVANFNRAFKSWAGVTAAAARRLYTQELEFQRRVERGHW